MEFNFNPKERLRRLSNTLFAKSGLKLTRHENFVRLIDIDRKMKKLNMLLAFNDDSVLPLSRYLSESRADFGQDLFALAESGSKRGGYFVEFGAADGIHSSNTWLLETKFAWSGILAEPAATWQSDLAKNRSANIELSCVWSNSGDSLRFDQALIPELSTISNFRNSDGHGKLRKTKQSYVVKSISLQDLLKKYNAPREIDYLSLDTEGSEFSILETFDFDSHVFRVITCEHNFTSSRQKIYSLLTANGYVRKFEEFSGFDDYYVRAD